MIIDSSAVLAVLLGEEDGPFYAATIEEAADPQMSAVSALELALVIGARKSEAGLAALDRFMDRSRIRVVAFDAEQSQLAPEAWGKGRHTAGLNPGDCCSYALAKASREMLLYIAAAAQAFIWASQK